jgi:hypothetical protein
VLDRLRELASRWPDHQVADRLNAEGLCTRTGKLWTYARVQAMRKQHVIPTACPLSPGKASARADGFVSSKVAAEQLGVSLSLVNLWVRHGVLVHEQHVAASKVWVRLTGDDLARLTGKSTEAADLPTFRQIMEETRMPKDALWEQVAAGHYVAFRVRQGLAWKWCLRAVSTKSSKAASASVRPNREGVSSYE